MEKLGILTLEEKKELWQKNLSGHQIKSLYNDFDFYQLWRVKKGEIQNPELDPKSRLKADFGILAEDIILKHIKKNQPLSFKIEDIKVDKNTYRFNDFEIGNIDGYLGDNINDIDWIIEIKMSNMSKSEIESWYKSQCMFYASRFNAKYGCILVYVDMERDTGCIVFERNVEYENDMNDKISKFRGALLSDTRPLSWKDKDFQFENFIERNYKGQQFKASLEAYFLANQQEKIWKDKKNKLRKFVEEIVPQEATKIHSFPQGFPISYINKTESRKKILDLEYLKIYLSENTEKNLSDFYIYEEPKHSFRIGTRSESKINPAYTRATITDSIKMVDKTIDDINYEQTEAQKQFEKRNKIDWD